MIQGRENRWRRRGRGRGRGEFIRSNGGKRNGGADASRRVSVASRTAWKFPDSFYVLSEMGSEHGAERRMRMRSGL